MGSFIKKQLHNLIFAALLTVCTVYVLLYVFVIPRGMAVVDDDQYAYYTPYYPDESPAAPYVTDPAATAPAEKTPLPQEPSPSDGPQVTEGPGGTSVPAVETATAPADPSGVPTSVPTSTPEPTPTPFNDFTSGEIVTTENTYKDAEINIVLTDYRLHDTDIHVADIHLRSVSHLRTAFAKDTFGRNIKQYTSVIAAEHGAILAVNGDYYGARDTGFVARNGRLYRESPASRDSLAIMNDGSFRIVYDRDVSARDLMDAGARQLFTFGPGLISDGRITVDPNSEVKAYLLSNQRTAVAVAEPLHYYFVVSDGRIPGNEGLSLYQLAEFLISLGVRDAYNLDGGGSSSMVFMGRLINVPTSDGVRITERSVSDIVYIG